MHHARKGANVPLPYDADQLDDLRAEAERALKTGQALDDLEVVDDAAAVEIADWLADAHLLKRKLESGRRAAKKPHVDTAGVIDRAWKPAAGALSKMITCLEEKFFVRKNAQDAKRLAEAMALEAVSGASGWALERELLG